MTQQFPGFHVHAMDVDETRFAEVKTTTTRSKFWELVDGTVIGALVLRGKVPGGWLVLFGDVQYFFVDPAHTWQVND